MDVQKRNTIIILSEQVNNYVKKLTEKEARPSKIDVDILLGHIRQLYECISDVDTELEADEGASQKIPEHSTERPPIEKPGEERTEKNENKDTENDEFIQLRRNIDKLKQQFDNFQEGKQTGKGEKSVREDTAEHKESAEPQQKQAEAASQKEKQADKTPPATPSEENKTGMENRADTNRGNGLVKEKNKETNKTLGESFNRSQSSLNDFLSLKNENNTTLGDQMKHNRVSDLKSAIDISHKFLFVNDLFGGNTSEYDETVAHLNKAQSLQEAFEIMQKKREKYNWDSKEGTFRIFNELIHRKLQ